MTTARDKVERVIAAGVDVKPTHGAGAGKPGKAANGKGRPFELVSAGDLLTAQLASQWDVERFLESGVNAGFVAPPEQCKSLLAQNIAACVATGRDFHSRKVRQGLAVYLCGEGFSGIRKRLQALELRHHLGLAAAPLVISRTSAPLLDPSECMRVRAAIDAAESLYGMPLSLLVSDTLSRFIAPGKESDAPDMGAYFQAIDFLRRGATALTLHHPGHGDSTRARGSSSWRASLDCEYTLAMSGEVLTVTCSKMKDAEKPEPFAFRLETAPTMTANEDGSPVQSVVLVPTEAPPSATHKKTVGKNQQAGMAALKEWARSNPSDHFITSDDLKNLLKTQGVGHKRKPEVLAFLCQAGILTPSIGGHTVNRDALP